MGSNPAERPAPEFAALTNDAFGSLIELFEAGEQVSALLEHPGWDYLIRVLDLAVENVDIRLDGQLLATRADYARLTGRRGGLRGCEEAAHAIVFVAQRRRAEQQRRHEGAAEPAPIGA